MTQNLSCGKCKAIRPFSGTPPTCDECGWVYTPGSTEARKSDFKAEFKSALSAILKLLFVVFALGLFCYWFYPATWYGFINGTDADHVRIELKPHDCDFFKAPLGDKECHFEKQVETQKDPQTGSVSVYVYWSKVEGNN